MQTVILVIHLIIALALIGAVLLQRSEGGALGIGSGGGGAGNLFSSRGVGNALTRTTAILGVCFFITSIALTLLAIRGTDGGGSLFETAPAQVEGQAPATAPADGGSVLPKLPAAPVNPQVPVSQ